jgi:thiol:disulfide interchange protein
MDARETIADAFGLILIGAAIILAVWEIIQQRNPARDTWLVTPQRLRRRLVLSFLLSIVGIIMTAEAQGVEIFHGLWGTLFYAGVLLCLAGVMVLLALADVTSTINAAARKSLQDLEGAMRSQRTEQKTQTDRENENHNT